MKISVTLLYISEMTESIPDNDWSTKSKKKLRIHKPYRNDELTALWKIMRSHEDRHKRHKLRENLKYAQNALDKR